MPEKTITDREKIIHLIENISDANAQRILIYIQGLLAGQTLAGQTVDNNCKQAITAIKGTAKRERR